MKEETMEKTNPDQNAARDLAASIVRFESYLGDLGIGPKLRELLFEPMTTVFTTDDIANLSLIIAPVNSWTRLVPTLNPGRNS